MRGFWREVFSDNGEGSFARVFTGVIVIASVVWVTRIVFHNHSMPELAGLSLFIGTLYGLNRFGTAAQTLAAKPTAPPPPRPPQ